MTKFHKGDRVSQTFGMHRTQRFGTVLGPSRSFHGRVIVEWDPPKTNVRPAVTEAQVENPESLTLVKSVEQAAAENINRTIGFDMFKGAR